MSGHGHVVPNADGSRARCGGPAICSQCALEYARLHLQAEMVPKMRCFCPCHEHPGTYPPPCSYCGHDTRQGKFPGSTREGWIPD